MAHTDKHTPLKFRKDHEDFTWRNCPNSETLVVGRQTVKFYKRLEHKRNRKRQIPYTSYRGYGYGDSNYRYSFAD